ncbi:relaxase MobL [candidate division NPL-UPA2 bacterium]|nr:relaxase MobL [candidate division NPL-UPA2 bacterium]
MSAPFVMKLKFYAPTAANKDKNRNHLKYIARRQGVVKNREISNEKYAQYIDERPGSHGLFRESGNADLKELQAELVAHKGIVWRGILSLREDDAVRLGFAGRQGWEKLLKNQMQRVAKTLNIKQEKMQWTAAFHAAKGHPHVHLVFWEKNPERTTGRLNREEFQGIKKIFAREVFREERLAEMMIKTAKRGLVREMVKGDLARAKATVREIRQEQGVGKRSLRVLFGRKSSLPPELTREKTLTTKLKQLSQNMPGKGRAAMKFMPAGVQVEAREIAAWIMQQPAFKKEVERYLEAQENISRTYTTKPAQLTEAREKAFDDLRDRVANVVIKGAAEIDREGKWQTMSNFGVANTVWRSAWQGIEQDRIQSEAEAEFMKRQLVREAGRKQKRLRGPVREKKENEMER